MSIWLSTIKSYESPLFLVCKWCVTYCWKALDEGYNFYLNLTSIEVYKKNYGPPKLWESQFGEFWDYRLGNPRTKWHLGVGPMAKHKKIL